MVLRNVAEINGRNLMGRTFGRVEIFGVDIYLAEQIQMETRKKVFEVSAASGR